jgi:glycosyltransferase involved in cell wall biosynthesis
MPSISYAITAKDEHAELERLVSLLILRMKFQDEIVIQVDSSNVTKEVLEVVAQQQNISSRIKLVKFPLNKDFATFKNNAYKQCTKDYIFQIDADEYPSDILIDNIHSILEMNPEIE